MKYFKQKTLFIFLITVFFVFTGRSEAGVVINEIKLSPIEDRFVELYNNGSESVDLTGYYLQRKTLTSDKFSSFVSNRYFEGKTIESGGYFLLSKSSLELDSFTITESNSIQLKNSKQEVVYKVGLGDAVDCGNACVPNPEENKSVQRMSEGEWVVSSPTPGGANSFSSSNSNSEEESVDEESGSGVAVKSEKEVTPLNPKISTKITARKTVVAGVPFEISHKTIGYKNEEKILGKFVWNFGNGEFKEEKYSPPFYYTYQYEAEYVLTLSFYDTHFSLIPEATDRISIKVIPSGISIVSVGQEGDAYVELENKSNYEIALYKWKIKGLNHTFVIPEGTIILPNRKIKLPSKITGFDFVDLSSVVILDDVGTVFAVYPKQKSFIPKTQAVYPVSGEKKKEEGKVSSSNEEENTEGTGVVNLNNLEASAFHSAKEVPSSIYPWVGLVVVIALGVIGAISLGKKKKEIKDYLEDEVRPEDMTILE